MYDATKPLFSVGQAVQHVKTQGVYYINISPRNGRLESTNEPAYSYTVDGSVIYHRGQKEMEDGRFVPYLLPTHAINH